MSNQVSRGLNGLKILVVDDSKTIRRTAETLLSKEGCQVFTAIDGFDAVIRRAWNWVFGKHPPRPPDPDRTVEAGWVPQWMAPMIVDELNAEREAPVAFSWTHDVRYAENAGDLVQ